MSKETITDSFTKKVTRLLPANIKNFGFTASQVFRSSQYLSQSALSSIILERKPSKEALKSMPPPTLILKKLWQLHQKDSENIKNNLYKAPEAWLESPSEFIKTSVKGFFDLIQVKRREREKSVTEVSAEDAILETPKYYQQNFHHQTDGWLSDHSASLYDHQVEVVFAGGAGAMRRQALLPIKKFLEAERSPAQELEFLDLATGTGAMGLELKHNYPKAHLTLSDLSPHYLKKARERLSKHIGTDFVQANAENLPFKDNHFDGVTCVYLFHELPKLARAKVLSEIHRVLKPGGIFVLVDSIQLGDEPEFDASLKYFPVHYHEPYYLSYIEQPYSEYVKPELWKSVSTDVAFFSKISAFQKVNSTNL